MAEACDVLRSAPSARKSLSTDLYRRLKTMARQQRRRSGSGMTYSTTELLHEAYLRVGDQDSRFDKSVQYFAYVSRTMRHILSDAARKQLQPKRGGDQIRLTLDDPAVGMLQTNLQMALDLDAALNNLVEDDARAAQVVELHYFCGLELQHIAEILNIARRTVDRDWRYARAFLASQTQQ